MIITLPQIKRTFDETTKHMTVTKEELPVEIDLSFKAHLKWEEQFASTVGCDLTTYTERVKSWAVSEDVAKAHFLGVLKLLYCYVNSPKLPSFKEFCGLFDMDVASEILTKLKTIFEELQHNSSKN